MLAPVLGTEVLNLGIGFAWADVDGIGKIFKLGLQAFQVLATLWVALDEDIPVEARLGLKCQTCRVLGLVSDESWVPLRGFQQAQSYFEFNDDKFTLKVCLES